MQSWMRREMWMRRSGLVLCLALFAVLTSTRVAAAGPAITVATRQDGSGAYIIASGQGFPANQPVMAFLVVENQAYPLAYQDLTASGTAPMTDAAGGFQNFAFTLPVAGQLTGTGGEVQISAGSVTARTPVGLDTGVVAKAGRGDKIAVGIGAGFTAVAALLIFLLLRGLPVYPVGTVATRRPKEPGTT
jgi:hypothetical protein